MSDWNDIIVRSFLIEQLEATKKTFGEGSISLEDELISKYNLLNVCSYFITFIKYAIFTSFRNKTVL